MTKHTHYNLIIEWANGAQIQCFNEDTDTWYDSEKPMWYDDKSYRVKPDEDVITYTTRKIYINDVEHIAEKFKERGIGTVHPSYKEIGSVILTFKGNELVSYHNLIINGVT
jgi:hypothetical protein